MGSLFIQIGQCGCQIGSKLNPLLSKSYYCTRKRTPNRLHTLMIDTQPKVLKNYIQKPPKWLDPANVKYFQHGRGNNWSYGYMHEIPSKQKHCQILAEHKQYSHNNQNNLLVEKYCLQNKQICEYVLNQVRHQLQTVDCALSMNILSSLGGGTGSGLGTKIIQHLHQQFNIDLFAHLVLPNKSGQTPLQVYNCTLSLASMQQHCSGIFVYENDNMVQMMQNNNENLSKSLDDINQQIATAIANMVRINDVPNYQRFYSQIVNSCVLSYQMKYLTLWNTSGRTWDTAFSNLYTQLKIYNEQQFIVKKYRQKLLSSQMILMGKQPVQFGKYSSKLSSILNLNKLEQTFQFEQIDYPEFSTKQVEKQQHITLIMNHTNILNYLNYLLNCGRKKFEAKAYLWHYQYADLQTAFQCLDKTVQQYYYFAHG